MTTSVRASDRAATLPHSVTPDELVRIEEIDLLAARGKPAVDELLGRLSDRAWTVRRAVIAALASLGNDAVPALCDALRLDRSDETRIAALVDALSMSTGDAETPLVRLARDHNPAVVADVAQILGRRRYIIAVPTLVWLSQHADDNVAVAAIEALGKIGGRSAVDALVAAVEGERFFRAFPALDVLGRSGDPRAVAPLAGLLHKPHYTLEAARALGRTGDRGAVAPLAQLLASAADSSVRVAAVALLDLQERHRQLYGDGRSLDDTVRAHAPANAGRRLAQCVAGADPSEQVAICRLLGALRSEAAVPALTPLLSAQQPVALAAAYALKELGRQTDAEVLKALKDADSERRRALLPMITNASSAPDVVACLRDHNAHVRALACDALARIGNPTAVAPLFDVLADKNPRVVQAAVGAIQSLGSDEARTRARSGATSTDAHLKKSCLRILAYFGDRDALDVFAAALADDDARVREAAIQGLPFLEGERAFSLLLKASVDADDKSRCAAMRALGHRAGDERAVAYLLRGLADPLPWVRYYACQSLGRFRAEVAAPHIARLLKDEAGQVRVAAVEALSHLESAVAVQALREAARSPELDVKRAALIGLGIARRPDVLPTLLEAAVASDTPTRLVALSALSAFQAPSVLPVLARAASDPDEGIRVAAVGFLGSHPGTEATKTLIAFLDDPQHQERALDALSTFVEGRIEGVLAVLEHADDNRASLLCAVLSRLGRSDSAAALFDAAEMPHTPARRAAASALAALGTRAALDVVARMAREDPSEEVRRVCSLLVAP